MVTPTRAQEEIRDHAALDLLVVAPAGCGKTEALALRVQGMLNRSEVVSPRKVLVVTFSNRARDNIRERLRSYIGVNTLRDRVSVVNFHGLSARIIRAHANVIGLSPDLKIPETDIIGKACKTRNFGYALESRVKDALRDAKLEPRSDLEVQEYLSTNREVHALEIEQERVSRGELSYDDLPRLAELILANERVASLYKAHFGAVVVDEFQDLTPQQLRIVNAIGYKRTTFAGDLAQGIYGFTGAKPSEVNAAIEEECTSRVTFAESHRSSPAVLAAVNSLSSLTSGVELTAAIPDRWPGGGMFSIVPFPDSEAEALWMVELAQGLLERAPSHRVGIMARTAARRRFVEAELVKREIDFMRWDDGVLDTDAARMMRSMLSSFDLRGYERAENKDQFLREAVGIDSVVETDSKKSLAEALVWCQDLLQQDVSVFEIRSRVRVGDDSTLVTKPGIHVLTGHAGKGQQFDWALIVGAEDGTLPFFKAESDEELAEEARVLSVMLSRARHGAVIGYAKNVRTQAGRPRDYDPSPFLLPLKKAEPRDRSSLRSWLASVDWEMIGAR
ncbi:DNA helicase [Microbacterium sorbitolivorans]|uniref:DNA 3'-5' helicase n=1 Tax=Microbacterium sorbitolivorans TaxID=1867410 RepID=A0A367Y6S0_9MICO|nr:ATP-dependent helicase [Microbacterium sorbitolivorans]RCK61556.1 ATP-dependent helicase [Microbacterium sorbitolivorans]GGF31125.1 DNA helicase [Microbacterium sorbitolivorans]